MRIAMISAAAPVLAKRQLGIPFAFDAAMGVGRVSGIMPGGYTYGFRNWGNFTFGGIDKRMVGNGYLAMINWHSYDRTLAITVCGDQRHTLRPIRLVLGGAWDLDFSAVQPVYNASQSLTTWTVTIPTWADPEAFYNQALAVHLEGQYLQPLTAPWFNHVADMTVASATLDDQLVMGYRSNRSMPMGALSPIKYIGFYDILFAQWNVTTNQFGLIIIGSRSEGPIYDLEVDEVYLPYSRRTVAAYDSANNWTQFIWDTSGLTNPLVAGEVVKLRF